jgi:CubicO group peptidase (beta-lactamase class C family)
VLLGRIVEQVAGRPVDEVIRSALEPLPLTEMHFPADDDPGVPAPATVGYLAIDDGAPICAP